MKKFFYTFTIVFLITKAAFAVEVELPGNAGKVTISNGVVTIPQGVNVTNGEYKVTVDGKEVTLVFFGGKGSIKQ